MKHFLLVHHLQIWRHFLILCYIYMYMTFLCRLLSTSIFFPFFWPCVLLVNRWPFWFPYCDIWTLTFSILRWRSCTLRSRSCRSLSKLSRSSLLSLVHRRSPCRSFHRSSRATLWLSARSLFCSSRSLSCSLSLSCHRESVPPTNVSPLDSSSYQGRVEMEETHMSKRNAVIQN